MLQKHIWVVVGVALLVGSGMFYTGTQYEKKSLATAGLLRTSARMMNGQGGDQFSGAGQGSSGQARRNGSGMMGGGQNGDFVGGDVMSKDDKSITVKTRDGSSRVIYFSDSTTIGKATSGTVADLSVGEQVMVNGKDNPDGTLSAQNIQIRPIPTQ